MSDRILESVNAACLNDCVMGRRAFISHTALAAAAAALAACSLSNSFGPSSVNGSIKVGDYASLANTNGVALATVNGAQLAIVRTGASTFVALSRVCPHMGGTVGSTGNGFMCPVHLAQFSLTGAWTGGQRTSNLHSYPTTYNATTDMLAIG
jgi:Rieske Fe-S protein